MPWSSGRTTACFVDARTFEALSLCDGQIDLSLPIISDEVRAFVEKLEEQGAVRRCDRASASRPTRSTAAIRTASSEPRTGRSPASATTGAATATCPRPTRSWARSTTTP
ncbi:MAG: hypothetical protein ACLSVD_02960 [Eggerthellaceae bacterium]